MALRMPTLGTRWVLVIALTLLCWPDGVSAGEVPEKPPETPSLTNVRRQGWLRFTLNSGRIVVSAARGVNFSHSGLMRSDRGEQLSIRFTANEPVLSYELRTPAYRLLLDVSAGKRLQLRRLPLGERTEPIAIEFHEAPNSPLVLKVGSKENQRVYRAESLWHLFVIEPTAARQHLAPLLKIMLPEWDFAKASGEIESVLVHTAQSGTPPDQKLWAKWVQQLGDSSFAKREQADRKLREVGRAAATYLGQLDQARLDAEQRYRVARILQSMSDASSEELPQQIASWLSGDSAVWLALLSRDAEPTRRAALKRLEALVVQPLVFDPAADEPTRRRQIDVIRAKVEKKDEK